MTVAAPQQPYAQQPYAASAAHGQDEQYVQHTPVWVVVVRAFQVFFAIVIFGMAADLTHGVAMDAVVYALVCGLFTFIVVAYQLITEKALGARPAYNVWAVMALDLFMAILWLASLGANAALRATFTVDVSVSDCYSNGQAVNANYCSVSKRGGMVKRAAVLSKTGEALLSAIAGLSALMWLLFLASLIFHGHTYRLYYEANKKPSADNATVEMKAQGTPMLGPQGGAAAAPVAPGGPQYTEQQQYQSQMYPPHEQPQQQQQQQQQYPPQQQQQQQQQYPPAAGANAYPDPSYQQPHQQYQQPHELQHHQQQQPAYSPHGTPAPGQPYYPPQQYPPQ